MASDSGLAPSFRVAVSGIGLLTSRGETLEATQSTLAALPPGAPPLPRLEGLEARRYFLSPKALKLTDRKTVLAIVAASQALAGEDLSAEDRARTGIRIGCSTSDLQTSKLARALGPDPEGRCAGEIPEFAQRMLSGLHPFWLLTHLPNMVGAHLAIQQGLCGPNSAVTTGWIAGLQAIGETFLDVRSGRWPIGVSGGADCGDDPFDRAALARRDPESTLVPSEAAAILVLRPAGTRPRAEICGYGIGASATGSSEHSSEQAVLGALEDAGWDAATVDRVAWTSPDGAPPESLRDLFGPATPRWRGADPRLGHSFAASGAVEVALCLAEDRVAEDHLADGPGESRRTVVLSIGLEGEAAALSIATHRNGNGSER